jgi:hypothetical protein
MSARATWTFPPEIINEIGGAWPRVDMAVRQTVLAGAIRIQTNIKTKKLAGDPVSSHSHNLGRAIFYEPDSTSSMPPYRAFVFIGLEAPYGAFLNSGTGIYHEPDAHNSWVVEHLGDKPVARFEIGGEVIFSRREVHKGIRARHFMEMALAEETEAIMQDGIRRVRAALLNENT